MGLKTETDAFRDKYKDRFDYPFKESKMRVSLKELLPLVELPVDLRKEMI